MSCLGRTHARSNEPEGAPGLFTKIPFGTRHGPISPEAVPVPRSGLPQTSGGALGGWARSGGTRGHAAVSSRGDTRTETGDGNASPAAGGPGVAAPSTIQSGQWLQSVGSAGFGVPGPDPVWQSAAPNASSCTKTWVCKAAVAGMGASRRAMTPIAASSATRSRNRATVACRKLSMRLSYRIAHCLQ